MTEQRIGSKAVATAHSDADGLLTWERVFPRLPCPVQRQLLGRMTTSGGLTTHDLKEQLGNALPNRAKACVEAVLAGQSDCLPNFEVPLHQSSDTPGGDAIHSPDIALIGHRSSANPTPMLVELAQAITEPGRRLLVVTPTAKEAVAFLDRWTTVSDQAIGLALHPKENSASLSKNARAYTTSALVERGWTTTRNEMQNRLGELRTEHGFLQQARKRLPELQRERERLAECNANAESLDGDIPTLLDDPRWADLPLRADCAATLTALTQAEEACQQAEADVETIQQKQTHLHSDSETARSSGLMRKVFGLFRGSSESEGLAQCDLEHAQALVKFEQCQRTVTEHKTQRDRLLQRFRDDARQRCKAERQVHEATIAAIGQELTAAGIEPVATRSAAELTDAIDQRLAGLSKELPFAEQWLKELTEHRGPIDRHGLKLISVTVAPYSALGQDPLTPSRPIQLTHDTALILQAELLGAEELERITPYAQSWILVGQPRDGERSRDRMGIFESLWQRLDVPLWRRESGKRIARLDRSNRTPSTNEPLADQPEIELRFAKDDDDELILVEVAFPADWSLARGKSFLATELDEVRIETAGPATWTENDAGWTVAWSEVGDGEPIRIDLGSGVAEEIVEADCQPLTVALHFDGAAWDRATAQDWIDAHRFCRRAVRVTGDDPQSTTRPNPSVRSLAGAMA